MMTVKDSGSNVIALNTTEVGGEHTPHSIIDSSALPTGAATQTTLAAIYADLQLKADKTETQPVEIVAGGPADPATETTLALALAKMSDILTDLQLKADKTENQPVTIANAGTVATESSLLSLYSAIGQELVVLSGFTPASVTTVAAAELIAAQGVAAALYVTNFSAYNASGVTTWISIIGGATPVASVYLPANGSANLAYSDRAPLRLGNNAALKVQCETANAAVRANATAFVI